MQALVFRSEVVPHVVVEPGTKITGVKIPAWRYVPTMAIVTKQADADALPFITEEYHCPSLNQTIVHVNTQFADAQTARSRFQQR
jgi:hypothetical protein